MFSSDPEESDQFKDTIVKYMRKPTGLNVVFDEVRNLNQLIFFHVNKKLT